MNAVKVAGARAKSRHLPAPGTKTRRFAFALSFLLLAFAGAVLAASAFGGQTYRWQAFVVDVYVAPATEGRTRLVLTPLGEVQAATHATPLALTVRLRGISFDRVKELVARPPARADLERGFERTARESLSRFAAWQIGLGAVGGLLAPLLLRVRRLRLWLLSMLVGAGFVGALLFATVRTFDRGAFREPTYTGSLREAGAVIGFARDAFLNAERLGDKLRNVATNLNTLYGRINAVPGLVSDEDTVRVLHVSDIHNNRAAVDFVRTLADKFAVSVVIDTGDLTDFGSPVETGLARGLSRLAVPYVFVPGNHDSRATVNAVRANPRAVVLDAGEVVTVAGLRIVGAADPSSLRPDVGSVDTPPDDLKAAGERLAAAVAGSPPPPEIVCVHNPRQAEPLVGKVPLVLCGHMHRAGVETRDGTVICNAGTTGGAGARYFDRAEGVALSAAILTFTRGGDVERPRLLFIDQVLLDGTLSQYSISRRSFPAAPPPGEEPVAAVSRR